MMTELDAKTRQQIKVYSKWVSNKLKDVETCKVNDITTDLKDGTALIELAEILTKKKANPKFKKESKFVAQEVEKCDHAIWMFKQNGISLGDTISGKDINDKNIRQTLYLVWMLILNYSIDPAVRENSNFQFSKDNTNTDSKNIVSRNKIQLLKWATNKIKSYPNIQDKFKPYDLSICALIHEYYPDEINYQQLDKDDHDTNLTIANEAMNKLNIPVFITPDDLKCYDYKVDEDCLMTQLSALKSCLDKKFPKRKSLVSRQNPLTGKKKETVNENIQTDPIQHQKPRNGRPPAISSHKKVVIDNESTTTLPVVNDDEQSDQIDLKKTKVTSKSAVVFPIKKESNNKKNQLNLKKTETNPSPINKNLKFESKDIYSQSDVKDSQNLQIESTNFEIHPDPNYKLEDSPSVKKVETCDIGTQPDSDHIPYKQISSSSSNINHPKKAQTTTKDFGIQPDSEHSEKDKMNDDNDDNNQTQTRSINVDISIDSDEFINENSPKRLRNTNNKNSIEIQTDPTHSEKHKSKTKKLEIGGLKEKQVFTFDSDNSNSNHKKSQTQNRGTEVQPDNEDEKVNSKDQEVSNPITRRRKPNTKNPQRKHSKFHAKRRNTYFGFPTTDLIDNDSNPQLNSNDNNNNNVLEEEEEINDNQDHPKDTVISPQINTTENNAQVQTRNIQFDLSEESEEDNNKKPVDTSKGSKKKSSDNSYPKQIVTYNKLDEEDNENKYEDENSENEDEDENKDNKNKYTSNDRKNVNNDNEDENQDYEDDDENENKNNKNKYKNNNKKNVNSDNEDEDENKSQNNKNNDKKNVNNEDENQDYEDYDENENKNNKNKSKINDNDKKNDNNDSDNEDENESQNNKNKYKNNNKKNVNNEDENQDYEDDDENEFKNNKNKSKINDNDKINDNNDSDYDDENENKNNKNKSKINDNDKINENSEDENENKNIKNRNKGNEDENENKGSEEEDEQIRSRNLDTNHQRNHHKHSGTKRTKHRHKRIHSKRNNTHTNTTNRRSNYDNDEEEEENTEEEIENKPIQSQKTRKADNDPDDRNKRKQNKPKSPSNKTIQKRSIQSRNFNIESINEEEEEEDSFVKNNKKIRSRNPENNRPNRKKNQSNEINVKTDKNKLLETRDVGIQSPKSHRSKQFSSVDPMNENSSSSAPKTLRIKVNGNIDRSIVITVRNFSHHSKRNESAHSSRRHTHSTLNSPTVNSTSAYRSHTPHKSHSHYTSNPTSYSVPNTPKYKNQNSKKECSIVPVIDNDGNRTPSRKFKVHVKDQDLQVKKKFSDSVSGIKITFNDNQDNNSQKDEQNS